MTNLQAEADELNRVKDFDLDAWLDEVEPPRRVQTVNTRGDILGQYASLNEERTGHLDHLSAMAEKLPDDEDAGLTLSSVQSAGVAEEFARVKAVVEDIDDRMAKLKAEYAANKATFTLSAIDPQKRAIIAAEHGDRKQKVGTRANEETLKLFLAAVTSITIVHNGREIPQRLAEWTPAKLERFLARIGDGQASLLWDAYIGTASGDVTPPFSHAFSSGVDTSTS